MSRVSSYLRRRCALYVNLALVFVSMLPFTARATTVMLQTSLGVVEIQLFDTAAPLTVANFLNYVNSGAFNNSFIHRSMPGFVIQGGGFTWNAGLNAVHTNAPVPNEYSAGRSNLRGTIAMAKAGGDPNSATSQWFINLANNAANLDNQNGGFTVFGQVMGNGMAIVDAIAALPTVDADGPTSDVFNNLPLASPVVSSFQRSNLVMIDSVSVAAGGALKLVAGWNLLGNSTSAALNVAATFGSATDVASVWKWTAASAKWAFYTPLQADGGAAYAASKGYDLLTTINNGEGFWVNAKQAFTTQLPVANAVASASFTSLPFGWNLIAVGDSPTPLGFNNALSLTPPQAGTISPNVNSLWAWDSGVSKWYFYAPSLQAAGGSALVDFIAGKAYLDFTSGNRLLDPGMGFWVYKP